MKLSKVYEPNVYESDIYALWEKSEAFTPTKTKSSSSYCIVMPPPNANGNLHLGHALTIAVEDIASRYQRARGKQVLFLPGADHAGFETQVVYEKVLEQQGKSRFDFTREELYSQIWEFVQGNKHNFETQLRRLGASVDWTRYTFTLDQKIINRSYATFKKMWEDGLIYRGERLVNFCTKHGTAFADIEVEYKNVSGSIWSIKYPLTDDSGDIIVATTRPETMLGDTAVAVNPSDDRYKDLIGKTVRLPLTHREIPILADEMVDITFGTGAVKITPAHDQNDYDVAIRHDLPFISVITSEGKIGRTSIPKQYQGLSLNEARKKVLKDLMDQGYLIKEEAYEHSVGHCYKCGTIIEPLLRDQWFVSMKALAKPAIEAITSGKITFYPKSKQMQAVTYLEGLRDWNISRQIAWGIPIPAFQNIDDLDDWIYDERVSDEIITVGDKTYRRDQDVFDTWFSSSQWPFATLDYPDGDDFKQFFPNSLMETGFDILYQWVCRMIMLGVYVTGDVPFKSVYLHGLVLDEQGAKMSKSKGNVISPVEIMDEFGSDALRMGMIIGQTAGNNQPFGRSKVISSRNFCNKLWNIARYVEGVLGDDFDKFRHPKAESDVEFWMLSKLQRSNENISSNLEKYKFSESFDDLYHLIWNDVADWYIEASKGTLNKGFLAYILETILIMAHPFAPFVTETIWQTLAWESDSILAKAEWPDIQKYDKKKAETFEDVQKIVTETRAMVTAMGVAKAHLYFKPNDFLNKNSALISRLSKVEKMQMVEAGRGLHLTQTNYELWLDIDDQTAAHYRGKLESQLQEHEAAKTRLNGRLSNKDYLKKAPKNMVNQTKDQLKAETDMIVKLAKELDLFNMAAKDLSS